MDVVKDACGWDLQGLAGDFGELTASDVPVQNLREITVITMGI